MTGVMVGAAIVGWLACAALSYAITLGYFLTEYASLEDPWNDVGLFAVLIAIVGGPISLLVIFCLSGFARHGLRWRP